MVCESLANKICIICHLQSSLMLQKGWALLCPNTQRLEFRGRTRKGYASGSSMNTSSSSSDVLNPLGKGGKVKFFFIWIIPLILFEALRIKLLHRQNDRGDKMSYVEAII